MELYSSRFFSEPGLMALELLPKDPFSTSVALLEGVMRTADPPAPTCLCSFPSRFFRILDYSFSPQLHNLCVLESLEMLPSSFAFLVPVI